MSGERTSTEADALVERGLERYGEGDLDGALVEWEGALSLDPANQRAHEYVEYVRQNYDLLEEQFQAARAAAATGGPSEPADASPPHASDPVDLGWDVDEGGSAVSLPPPPESGAPKRGLTAELDLEAAAETVMGPTAGVATSSSDEGYEEEEEVIELEAELPEEGAAGGFELDPLDLQAGGLELEPEEPAPAAAHRPGTDGLDFGSPGLTQERTVELRTAHDASQAAQDEEDDEETVPGGEEPPPFGAGLSLSDDALAAIGAEGRPPAPERTRPPDETTAERSSLGGGSFALGELDELELATPRDDRIEDSQVRVTFRTEGTGTGALRDQPHDYDDGELTVERPSGRTAAGTSERDPLDLSLDDELTRERGGGDWSGTLGSDVDDLGEDATRERTGARPSYADSIDLGPVDLEVPDLAAGGWRQASADEATADLSKRDEFDDQATQQTAEMPGIDIGMAPLTDESMSVDAIRAQLDKDVERDAPAGESTDDRTRRRVTALIKRAESEANLGQASTAVTALDMALEENPESAVAQKVIHRHRDLLFEIYRGYIGDMRAMPTLAIPLHQLAQERLDNRAAFLLSRIDGSLSFEEILDVSGMTRLEAYRLLSRMLLRGILEVH